MQPVFINLVTAMLLLQLTISKGLLDCRTACRKCKEGTEDIEFLDVYCSMCKECRDKRRELLARRTTPPVDPFPEDLSEDLPVRRRNRPPKVRFRTFYRRQPALRMEEEAEDVLATWPEHCPTPPMCSEEVEQVEEEPPTTTTTTTTRPPTQQTCPPVADKCRPRKEHHNTKCVPCVATCPCPFPSEININVNWNGKGPIGNMIANTNTNDTNTNSSNILPGNSVNGKKLLRMFLMGYDYRNQENNHISRGDSIFDSDIEALVKRTNDKGNSNGDLGFNKKIKRKDTSEKNEEYFTAGVFGPRNGIYEQNQNPYTARNPYEKSTMYDREVHFTRKANIYYDKERNFKSTPHDQDYVYLYVGVPKNLVESQGATTPINIHY
ncbi:hypothetical protein O0L34_g16611 [Tuta absoluta]|nr:hypothetical protein O0L34_g16611 [Tuta absoluta]